VYELGRSVGVAGLLVEGGFGWGEVICFENCLEKGSAAGRTLDIDVKL